jgi:hypothetical protein
MQDCEIYIWKKKETNLHTPNEILSTTKPIKIYHIVSFNLGKPPKRIDAEYKIPNKELLEASPTKGAGGDRWLISYCYGHTATSP